MKTVIDMQYKVTRDDEEVGYASSYASALRLAQSGDWIEQLTYYDTGEIDFRTINGSVEL